MGFRRCMFCTRTPLGNGYIFVSLQEDGWDAIRDAKHSQLNSVYIRDPRCTSQWNSHLNIFPRSSGKSKVSLRYHNLLKSYSYVLIPHF